MQSISLQNAVFEGENTIYLLGEGGEGPLTLIDSGFDDQKIREQVEDGLANVGYSVSDIDQILLTHYHGDHTGLAGWIQQESDATVRIHPIDAPLAAHETGAIQELRNQQETYFADWGMPESKRDEVRAEFEREIDLSTGTLTVEPISDGETVRAGPYELTACHLPGHTAGHVGYLSTDERLLWGGDVLLPYYTPNIGGADVRLDDALATYLDTLTEVVSLGLEAVWPGHRARIDDPSERAREIYHHHRDRTRNVVNVLREFGPLDTWSVSHNLFGELHEIHILHGPGEAHVHLEHLEAHDVVSSTDGVYTLCDSDPNLDEFFPNFSMDPEVSQ